MKEKILTATSQLIVQYGLRKFTLDEIAAELRISKKTIYKYFKSKDEIIATYFMITIDKDKENICKELEKSEGWIDKIHAVVYSSHPYKIPISQMKELQMFYPAEWAMIEELKQFKFEKIKESLLLAKEQKLIREHVNFEVLVKMLSEISDMFLDSDFLIANKLNAREAIDEAFEILLYGIVIK